MTVFYFPGLSPSSNPGLPLADAFSVIRLLLALSASSDSCLRFQRHPTPACAFSVIRLLLALSASELLNRSQFCTACTGVFINFAIARRHRTSRQNFNHLACAASTYRQARRTFALTRQTSQFPLHDPILE